MHGRGTVATCKEMRLREMATRAGGPFTRVYAETLMLMLRQRTPRFSAAALFPGA
jgi:hypothetical protein